VSLAFDANALENSLLNRRQPEAAMARRIANHLDDAITESRQLSRGLFPVRLETDGLARRSRRWQMQSVTFRRALPFWTAARFQIGSTTEWPHIFTASRRKRSAMPSDTGRLGKSKSR